MDNLLCLRALIPLCASFTWFTTTHFFFALPSLWAMASWQCEIKKEKAATFLGIVLLVTLIKHLDCRPSNTLSWAEYCVHNGNSLNLSTVASSGEMCQVNITSAVFWPLRTPTKYASPGERLVAVALCPNLWLQTRNLDLQKYNEVHYSLSQCSISLAYCRHCNNFRFKNKKSTP